MNPLDSLLATHRTNPVGPISVGAVRLLPDEERLLKAAGWSDGDALPDPAAIEAILTQVKADNEHPTDSPVNDPEFRATIGKVVEFKDLSPEQQQELVANIQLAKQQAKRLDEMMSLPAVPGLAEAVAVAQAPVVNTPPPAAPRSPSVTGHDNYVLCPHCSWDLARTIEDTVTLEDKRAFVVCLRTGHRFTATVSLVGGDLRATFRQLTTQEEGLCFQQVAADVTDGLAVNQGEWWRRLKSYQRALGLAKLVTANGQTITFPEITAWGASQKERWQDTETPVRAYTAWVEEHYLKNSSFSRIVGIEYTRFQRRIEHLEANATNEDFFKGITSA